MTRINLVDPIELTDQHLIAEYRELLMVPGSLRRSLRSKKGVDLNLLPKKYSLNGGHVSFFYDKLKYLEKRYMLLIHEMKNRNMNPNPDRVYNVDDIPPEFYNDYVPDSKAFDVIFQRISERIALKPNWYRYYGKPILECNYFQKFPHFMAHSSSGLGY